MWSSKPNQNTNKNKVIKPKGNKREIEDLDDYEPPKNVKNDYGLPASFFTDEVDDKPQKLDQKPSKLKAF